MGILRYTCETDRVCVCVRLKCRDVCRIYCPFRLLESLLWERCYKMIIIVVFLCYPKKRVYLFLPIYYYLFILLQKQITQDAMNTRIIWKRRSYAHGSHDTHHGNLM